MTLGARIEERRREVGISQAELARRVGVRQSTINSLINGDSRTSRSLLQIARELGTTPAYLTGEVDDPEQDAPAQPELTHEERELLDCFRVLTPTDRLLVQQLVRSLAGRGGGEPKAFSRSVYASQLEFHGEPDKRG